MKKQQVIDLFGSVDNTARQLDITHQAVYKWPETLPVRADRRVRAALRDWLKSQGKAR